MTTQQGNNFDNEAGHKITRLSTGAGCSVWFIVVIILFFAVLGVVHTCEGADPGREHKVRKRDNVERAERKALRRVERKIVYPRPKAGRIIVIAAFAILSGAIITNQNIQ